jgi:parallel beta-helix repeat protein
MNKKSLYSIILVVILTGIFGVIFEANAETTIGVITIYDDGSINPAEAPISRNGEVFTLTDDIAGFGTWGIEILRSNIILDGNGHTLRSTQGYGMGIDIDGHYYLGVNNVTIRNLNIKDWGYGVFIDYSSDNKVYGNNLTENAHGVFLSESSGNDVFENNVTASTVSGISLVDSSNSNNVTRNNITNNILGIWFGYSAYDNNVTLNSLTNNNDGMYLMDASNNKISRNNITNNEHIGVRMGGAFNNSLSLNMLNNVTYGFEIRGNELGHFLHSIDVSNLVDEKPVYYLINQSNLLLSPATHPQVGYLALINCTGISVQQLNLTNNGQGLLLAYTENAQINNIRAEDNINGMTLYSSSNNTISNSDITKNLNGIKLAYSLNNSISGNKIASNNFGIGFENSSKNSIYHNNFVNNTNHTYDASLDDDGWIPLSINDWDNDYPWGGNYWDNHNGTDFNMGTSQNETGSDGIGDNLFSVYENNTDNYPLMGMFSSFNTSLGKHVNVVSNSTVKGFEYELNGAIRFYVSNMTTNQSHGFCRVTIPHDVLPPPYNITVGYEFVDYDTIFENDTHSMIYFSYPHSQLEVIITPEFPSLLILPLFMVLSLLATITYRRKHALKV